MPLEIVRNDITKMEVDAIVNAANSSLLGGGGVDGCIHRAAGPGLLEECRGLGGCRPGDAKMTKAYDLPCSHVIHTVGPIWRDGYSGERKILSSCYRTSLALAKEAGCQSVAFPLIASGIFGYPKDKALRVAVNTIGEFLMENDMTVYLVVFDPKAYQISSKLLRDITEYIDDNYFHRHWDPRREGRRSRREEESASFSAAFLPIEEDEVLEDMVFPRNAMYSLEPDNIPEPIDTLEDFLTQLDAGFSETLLELIWRSGEKPSDIYHRANVDRRLFSHIKNNPRYQPSKTTAIAFAVALRLDLNATKDFIARAGFTLSRASKFDLIIEFFIRREEYNIFEINAALFSFDQPLLGF